MNPTDLFAGKTVLAPRYDGLQPGVILARHANSIPRIDAKGFEYEQQVPRGCVANGQVLVKFGDGLVVNALVGELSDCG